MRSFALYKDLEGYHSLVCPFKTSSKKRQKGWKNCRKNTTFRPAIRNETELHTERTSLARKIKEKMTARSRSGSSWRRPPPPPPGEDSHMKQTGMFVVSLRSVNFGFWSRLGCSGQSANILCHQGLVLGSAKKHRITRRETEVNFCFNFPF